MCQNPRGSGVHDVWTGGQDPPALGSDPCGQRDVVWDINVKVLAQCTGTGSHRQLPGLISPSLQVTDLSCCLLQ